MEIKINAMQYIYDNSHLLYSETGEIVSINEAKKIINRSLRESVSDYHERMYALGLPTDLTIVKNKGSDYMCKAINPRHQFNKMYRTAMKEIVKLKELTVNARALFMCLIPYLEHPSNIVYIPNLKKFEEIGEWAGLKPTATYAAFKNLEHLEIIKRVKFGKNTTIYLNPYIISTGKHIDTETLEIFKDSIYNTQHGKNKEQI